MKSFISITIILMLTASCLIIGNSRAEAMNNESAAMLAGAIAIFGKPMLNAMANEIMYPGQEYAPSRHTQYRTAYPATTRYVERTEVIYVRPEHERFCRHKWHAYKRGYRDGWRHYENRRERHDSREDYDRHHDDD
ncbi:MAG: hypothetical protein HY758_08935 [Nitrospirae bacterium]|nr:hypothetical protein [Nitrospirota bacterium]